MHAAVSQLAELRQFLVPCVNCDLSVPLPVGVWGTLLSGVGDAKQLERLRVVMHGKPVSILWFFHIVGVCDVMTLHECCPCMQRGTGPEWDHIDQTTLEEVEKSWAHSRCREVKFDITGSVVSVCACVHVRVFCYCMVPHLTSRCNLSSLNCLARTLDLKSMSRVSEEAHWMQPSSCCVLLSGASFKGRISLPLS